MIMKPIITPIGGGDGDIKPQACISMVSNVFVVSNCCSRCLRRS